MWQRWPGGTGYAAADKAPQRARLSARGQVGGVPDDARYGEDAPTHSLNTHLAFSDAQTQAMLDPAAGADKD
jgi:hypothetical protein